MSEQTAQDQYNQEFPAAPVQHDYFGFQSSERYTFPDGVSWIEFEVMNEGKKSKFQKDTQRDLIIERTSGNARTKVDPSAERHALIDSSMTGWNLRRGTREVPFNAQGRRDFLELADPKVIEDLEKAIRKANPWMLGEMSVEDIDREIDSMKEMREVAVKREEEKADSSSK